MILSNLPDFKKALSCQRRLKYVVKWDHKFYIHIPQVYTENFETPVTDVIRQLMILQLI